jgi:periplasmic mercuric ion binding protein
MKPMRSMSQPLMEVYYCRLTTSGKQTYNPKIDQGMKKLILSAAFTCLMLGLRAQEVNTRTDSFRVAGNCGMCEKRIETAASTVKGVVKADWDAAKGMMVLIYHPAETTIETVQKAIAAAGHDTDKAKASNKVYSKLPGCCQYKRDQ